MATSRIVTMVLFMWGLVESAYGATASLNSCRGWRTLQQRVKPVSSSGLRYTVLMFVLVSGQTGSARPTGPGQAASYPAAQAAKSAGNQAANVDPQKLFEQGEAALKGNDLAGAERAFKGVLAVNPEVAGAYANLGVIAMRRKQWPQALERLRKAGRLAPQVAGIRLNIGLVYYRQNDFLSAIEPFESVLRDVPGSYQARYLLGLCYFFNQRYAEAASTLEPLWGQASDQLSFLYVLGIAANKAGRAELEQRALGRLMETGQDSAELHLLMGKAHLNREEYDEAIIELESAAKAEPRLPFVHFNLGLAYLKKQDLERAKAEFLKDIEIEPDVAYDYDQLGLVFYLQQQDEDAEKMFRKALRLDPRLSSSDFQLARVCLRERKYEEALAAIEAAGKMSPQSESVHYVRGQILQHLGRTQQAKAEMEKFTEMSNASREKRHQEMESEPVPDPELTREPQ
ncbi:MAG: tetratricopeptide repeat protein [Terriglobales bacterium]